LRRGTHDIFIGYNKLETVRAEAIELEPHSYNHIVRGVPPRGYRTGRDKRGLCCLHLV
jgi:hypothetical protein